MVSLAEPFFKEGYKGTFVLLEPITVRDYIKSDVVHLKDELMRTW
jgi:hypothetical protein